MKELPRHGSAHRRVARPAAGRSVTCRDAEPARAGSRVQRIAMREGETVDSWSLARVVDELSPLRIGLLCRAHLRLRLEENERVEGARGLEWAHRLNVR